MASGFFMRILLYLSLFYTSISFIFSNYLGNVELLKQKCKRWFTPLSGSISPLCQCSIGCVVHFPLLLSALLCSLVKVGLVTRLAATQKWHWGSFLFLTSTLLFFVVFFFSFLYDFIQPPDCFNTHGHPKEFLLYSLFPYLVLNIYSLSYVPLAMEE